MLNIIRKVQTSSEAREQAGVFTSQFLLNLSFFAVMFVASKTLAPNEFAKLSLANSYIGLLSIVFIFGLDQTALKLSYERGNDVYIELNLITKTCLILLSSLLLVMGAIVSGASGNLSIIAAAAGGAFWSATRVVEQYERRFRRLSFLNVIFSATRAVFGIAAVAGGNWELIVLSLYVIAQAPMQVGTLTKVFRRMRRPIEWSALRPMLAVSPLMFASGALYNALPTITMSILFNRGDALATSAFGVALIFTAPMNILLSTIRIYVLPQILSRELKEVDLFGLGPGSFNNVVLAFAAICLLATLPTAIVIQWFYGTQMPQAGLFFLIYFGALVITASVGLHNIRDQRRNLVRVAVAVNACRALGTGAIMLVPGLGPLAIVTWSAAILVGGEVVLWAALGWAERYKVAA